MGLTFDCVCGETIRKDAEFGDVEKLDSSATCDRCGRGYVLTISGLGSVKTPAMTLND